MGEEVDTEREWNEGLVSCIVFQFIARLTLADAYFNPSSQVLADLRAVSRRLRDLVVSREQTDASLISSSRRLWRDYFTFLGQKYGSTLFDIDGFNSITHPNVKSPTWKYADEHEGADALKRWTEGRTGVPFVSTSPSFPLFSSPNEPSSYSFIDANMNELRLTGFQSNRGRQNVACYLTKDLFVDWRAGAEVFEEELVDYDTSSNWGNWQYGAGVGTDPRDNRYFNPISESRPLLGSLSSFLSLFPRVFLGPGLSADALSLLLNIFPSRASERLRSRGRVHQDVDSLARVRPCRVHPSPLDDAKVESQLVQSRQSLQVGSERGEGELEESLLEDGGRTREDGREPE